MTTATAPHPIVNNYNNDYLTQSGVRICTPLFIDLTNSQRKQLLNAVREVSTKTNITETRTQSGIRVETNSGAMNSVELYLGTSIDLLRSLLFTRGGLAVDLVLKLQEVTGLEMVSVKEIEAAMKTRINLVKNYSTNFPYNP